MKIFVELKNLGEMPEYAKDMDIGADLKLPEDVILAEGINKIPLDIAVHIPNGYVGFVLPRSGKASQGITCEPVPIDPSYTGIIHAIINNTTGGLASFNKGTRIAQLVILPAIRAEFTTIPLGERGQKGFNSTGD